MKHVVIAGGTGFIGRALQQKLLKDFGDPSRNHGGIKLTLISRSHGANCITWPEVKNSGLPPCDVVINLAGKDIMIPIKRFDDKYKFEICESRIQSTKILVDAISRMADHNRPQRYIGISGINYYENSKDSSELNGNMSKEWSFYPKQAENFDSIPTSLAVKTEESPPGSSFFSRLCVDWETASDPLSRMTVLRNNEPKAFVKRNILRTGVVLSLNGGILAMLKQPVRLNVSGPLLPGHQPFPWIHVEDLCRLFVCIMNGEIPDNKVVINAVAPNLVSSQTFTSTLAHSMKKYHLLSIPQLFTRLIFGNERASELLLNGVAAFPYVALESGFKFEYPTIEESCGQFEEQR